MIYITLAQAFVLSPLLQLPPDDEAYFYSLERCAAHATPAEPYIWSATLVKRDIDGSRLLRLTRNMGHARKHRSASLPALPEPPLMLISVA